MDKRQSIIRTKRTTHFTTVNNDLARAKHLTHAAKGLLLQMLSYPDDWVFSLKHMAANSAGGITATRTAFQELEAQGYVSRKQLRNEVGQMIGYEYTVFDTPTGVSSTGVRNSNAGEPHATNTELTKNEDTNLNTLVKSENRTPVGTQSATPTHQQEVEAIIQAWNDNRGTLPAVTVLSEARKRRLRSLIKEHNGQATALIRDATRQVANNSYWQENRYTLDNLLAGGKYLQHAEAYRHTNERPKYQPVEVPF